MEQMDFEQFNKPPFFPQLMCEGETLELARVGDAGLTEIDSAAIIVADSIDLATCTGVALDRAGRILQVQRNGKADEIYRVVCQLRALLNKMNGNVEDVILLVKFLYGATVITVSPAYPAGIAVTHNGRSSLDAIDLAYFSDGFQIGFSTGDFMVFSSPDYSLDEMVASVIPAGVGFTITKV